MIAKVFKFSLISALFLSVNWTFADSPALQISAINAGFKNDSSSQNYDFIELSKNTTDNLPLAGYKLLYYNSTGNLAGELDFSDYILVEPRLVLYFSGSPEAADLADEYLYGFSSSGLASTAGKIQLAKDEDIISEICWGKNTCENFHPKFKTNTDNASVHLVDGIYVQEKYYPVSTPSALQKAIPDPIYPPCENIIITEYQSYTDLPFVEIYNNSAITRDISGCQIRYKNTVRRLSGLISPGAYYASYDIKLSKNPSTMPAIQIIDEQGNVIDEVAQADKQRKDTSMILVADGGKMVWKRSYVPTPSAENIFQEFQTCPEGKIINPLTGNCVKETATTNLICPEGKYLNILTGRCKTIETKKSTTCKDGYYLNPLTGRCKKKTSAKTSTECKEGYERNPETNRCRKIAKNSGDEYKIKPIEETKYDNPQIFVATGAIIGLVILAVVCVCFQFRKEIKKRIMRLCHRRKS